MFKNIDELKDFIIWAKSEKVKAVKVGEISVELSDLALTADLLDIETPKDLAMPPASTKLPDGNTETPEDEQLLFWSAR